MVSTTSLFAVTISTATVQIEPQFKADWNSIGDDTALIALYVEKAKENGYDKDICKLLDSDTNLYGADCGYSDPKAKPKTPPSDGTATFSRGLAHHGPCEIWLDDKMVFHNDDCAKDFGAEDYMSTKSVLKPIDYSSCSASSCMLRFYWLAFQGSTSGKYVWQIYKDCIPLTGPGAGKTSTAGASGNTTQSAETPSSDTTSTQTPTSQSQNTFSTESPTSNFQSTEAPAAGAPTTNTPESQTNQTPMTQSTENPEAGTPANNAPETQTNQAPMAQSTPAPQTWDANTPATQAPSTNAQPPWSRPLLCGQMPQRSRLRVLSLLSRRIKGTKTRP